MEKQTPRSQSDYLYLPLIATAVERLSDAKMHVAQLNQNEGNIVLDDALFYANEDLRTAREAVCEAVTTEAFSRRIGYDDAIDLLRRLGFDCGREDAADFDALLSLFPHNQAVLLKKSHYYTEDIVGTISKQPFVIPYGLLNQIKPVIVAEITTDNANDVVMIPIRKSDRTEAFLTPSVVVGKEAIEKYQTRRQ